MADYQRVQTHFTDGTTTQDNIIKRKTDNAYIPMDESNRDYQEYLEWVAAGNTADPAA